MRLSLSTFLRNQNSALPTFAPTTPTPIAPTLTLPPFTIFPFYSHLFVLMSMTPIYTYVRSIMPSYQKITARPVSEKSPRKGGEEEQEELEQETPYPAPLRSAPLPTSK